jgi:hypothetical protein
MLGWSGTKIQFAPYMAASPPDLFIETLRFSFRHLKFAALALGTPRTEVTQGI